MLTAEYYVYVIDYTIFTMIGISGNPEERLRSHHKDGRMNKYSHLMRRFSFFSCKNQREARTIERQALSMTHPIDLANGTSAEIRKTEYNLMCIIILSLLEEADQEAQPDLPFSGSKKY